MRGLSISPKALAYSKLYSQFVVDEIEAYFRMQFHQAGREERADAAVLPGVCLSAHLRCHLSFAQFSARKGQSDRGKGRVGSVKNSQSSLGPRVTSSLPSRSRSLGRSLTYLSQPSPFARSAVPPSIGRTPLAVKTSGHSFSGAPFPLRSWRPPCTLSLGRTDGGRDGGRKVSRLWQGWVGLV